MKSNIFIIILLAIIPVLTSCGGVNIQGIDCPYPNTELQTIANKFIDFVPDAFSVLDRTDVFCLDVPSFYNEGREVKGITLWPGSTLRRARIKIAADIQTYPKIENTSIAHEFLHLYLWDIENDPCRSHDTACKWDTSLIQKVNGEL
jgi:hypothetical protein